MPDFGALPHILVVDDDDRLRDLLLKYLGENGFLVTGAEDAKAARSKLGMLEFDLLVLDLMMPGESGLDLARDLRRSLDVPILMLTAMNEADDRIRGLEHGADDYLGKPFDPGVLLRMVKEVLVKHKDYLREKRTAAVTPKSAWEKVALM